ncbi:MAG: SDR family oxidoreductase [Pseudomonadota bacterium]
MSRLAGKKAIVTGGGSGIGRSIVEHFVAKGAEVLTCGRRARPNDLSDSVHWQSTDVSSVDDVRALIYTATELWGGLDILVNNAGIQIEKTVLDTTDEDWDLLMGANARGVFLCCREAMPLMIESGGGSIVNIGSIAGNVADIGLAIYNASKAFVHGLTRSIATDHGKQGIRCNAICPGWIMTEMADAAFAAANDPQAAKTDALARHATSRFGEPADIAKMAVWLASDDSTFANGQEFTVDGGLTAASPLNPGLF